MNANNTFLTGSVANPFAGLLPGTSFNNCDDRTLAAAAPVPAVRRHPNDEQRWQVVVPLRPGRPAEAVLEGLHARRLLHLLALDAGDRVPERGRRGADQDDLGPRRAAPAVGQRHPRAPVREGAALPVGRERLPERARRRLAGPGRLHLPVRLPRPVRQLLGCAESPRGTSSTTAATSRSTTRASEAGSIPPPSRRSSPTRRRTRPRSTTCGRCRTGSTSCVGIPSTTSTCR